MKDNHRILKVRIFYLYQVIETFMKSLKFYAFVKICLIIVVAVLQVIYINKLLSDKPNNKVVNDDSNIPFKF